MTKPDFFMVGAPKTATTAIAQFLRSHANVFMCDPKEPYFFSSDIGPSPFAKDANEYMALFSSASRDHAVVAEASVSYLMSEVACNNIFQFNPKAKILVTLRNPIDLIYAWHSEMIYAGEESVVDFEQAWYLQEARSRGEQLPTRCTRPLLLQYRKVGLIGAGLNRFINQFGHAQVAWILFDDFKADPRSEYSRLLHFLQLPLALPDKFPDINSNKRHRVPALGTTVRYIRQRFARPINRAIGLLGLRKTGIIDRLDRLNTTHVSRRPLSQDFRQLLKGEFKDDILILEKLIGRDLSNWLA